MPEPAGFTSRGGVPCRARFGSLDIRWHAEHRRYLDILPAAFRVRPEADVPGTADLELVARDAAGTRAPVEGTVDMLRIDSADGVTRVTTEISELTLGNPTARDARLTVHVEGQDRRYVDHYLVMNIQKLLQLLGRFRLHGAAAVHEGRTYVFLGGKGAGKSTLSLALGRAGATILADDQLVVRRSGERILVSGVDGGLRVTQKTEGHFFARPLGAPSLHYAGVPKKEVALADHVAAKPGVDETPHTLLFLRVGDHGAIEALPRRVALRRVLDDLIPMHRFAGPDDQRDFLALVTAFVRAVDVFDLCLSPDLRDLESLPSILMSTG